MERRGVAGGVYVAVVGAAVVCWASQSVIASSLELALSAVG